MMSDTRTFTLEPLLGGGEVPEWSPADRLRKAREWADLDQAGLARLTALSRATISAAENGRRTLQNASIRLWAVSTGVSLTWLQTGEAPAPEGDGASKLPELDSNQQPAGFKHPVTSIRAVLAA